MRNAFLCALLTVACAAPVPPPAASSQAETAKPANIRGVVTHVAPNEIRVEADAKEFRGAKAVVKITGTTEIRDAAGKPVAASAIREGQMVSVWFGGAVAQSYPLQTEAVTIVIE